MFPASSQQKETSGERLNEALRSLHLGKRLDSCDTLALSQAALGLSDGVEKAVDRRPYTPAVERTGCVKSVLVISRQP